MASEYVSVSNLRFLLFDVLASPQLNRLGLYQDYDQEAYELAVDAAKDIAD